MEPGHRIHEIRRRRARDLDGRARPREHRGADRPHPCREHGPTFDTEAAVLAYKRSGMAHLIGDCYLPRLARQLGMHLGYYHLPANWCEGYAPEHPLEGTLDTLYLNRAEPCARFELAVMRRLEVPTSCECMALRVVRPAAYMSELSPPATLAPGVNTSFDPPDARAPTPRTSGGHAP